MVALIGIIRSTIRLRKMPERYGKALYTLRVGTWVKKIGSQGNWIEVETIPRGNIITNIFRRRKGFLPRESMYLIPEQIPIDEDGFPEIGADGRILPPIPQTVIASKLLEWWEAGANQKPPWITKEMWDQISEKEQQQRLFNIKDAMQEWLYELEYWVKVLNEEGRSNEAAVDEWLTILRAHKAMWAIRDERIFERGSTKAKVISYVNSDEILTWTGGIIRGDQEGGKRDWYEVYLHKFDRDKRGWFKAGILEDFFPPTQANDPAFKENAKNIFKGEGQPTIFIPQDAQIRMDSKASQYIDLDEVIGRNLVL